ncbi:hypothetical protein ACP70R_042265 [Stipagrostis hirtigluma subsp. patula]
MAELVVSASTGAMGSVLTKLGTMMDNKCKELKGVRGDIKDLKDELEAMHAFLMTMGDVEEPDEQDKVRVKAVRELSYEIEDTIDKSMLLGDHSSSETNFFKKVISKTKELVKEFKVHNQLAKAIKDIKKQVEEVAKRHARYKIDGPSYMTGKAVVDLRARAIYKDASQLVGIEGPKDKLIELLQRKEGESTDQLKVVSIVGFGGLGKTTLASRVSDQLRPSFDCWAFAPISRNPDVRKVLSSIFSQVSGQNVSAEEDPHVIIGKIRNFLEHKSLREYFIVVDDIWKEQMWDNIKHAFVDNNCGSRIIVTTRINGVAKKCSSCEDLVYQIKPLSDFHSKKLFLDRIFGCEKNCPSNLKEASDEILKKCGGLPLAIIAISGLLANEKDDMDLWDKVRNSISDAYGKCSEENVRKILSLSYFDLPHDIRSCLLYLAMFPEDYEIKRPRLVHRWIAEGFINGKDEQDRVDLGDRYFHELVNRSLIQPLQIAYDGKAGACRVHDTILDFLIHKSHEDNFCTVLSQHSEHKQLSGTRVRRLSLLGDVSIPADLDTSHLRSICVFEGYSPPPSIMDSDYLRVVDLGDCDILENDYAKSIRRLSLLRYFKVNGVPGSHGACIGEWQYLETLDVGLMTDLETVDVGIMTEPALPAETVTRLKRLVRLFVSYGSTLPDGIQKLENLQELSNINADMCSLDCLEGLAKVIKLRHLSISWRIDDREGDNTCRLEKLISTLCELEAANLRNLNLNLFCIKGAGLELDSIFPSLKSIRTLTLYGLPNMGKTIKWLVSLPNLEWLWVGRPGVIEKKDLELIGSIPALRYLELDVRESGVGPIVITGGFQKLHQFCFRSWHDALIIQGGALSELRDLRLEMKLDVFKRDAGGFDCGIQHLPCLASISITITKRLTIASSEDIEDAVRAFKSMVEAHKNRPTLEIDVRELAAKLG